MQGSQTTFKSLRMKAGLGTDKAAQALDISMSTLYKVEQGHKRPSVDLINAMCDVYNCEPNDIFLAMKIANSDKRKSDRTGSQKVQ